ncbi:hypothetical protein AWJ19_24870 [Paenibacillus sp. DMB5]|nr:hypothetical protein AWJ19_28510 [Paenibacillus sp. DMB5]KUP26252.1 hypothetical protein AWJ19_24870 [Paenibacillus sp. DMB5]
MQESKTVSVVRVTARNVWAFGRCCLRISCFEPLAAVEIETAYASEASFPAESFQADANAPTAPKFLSDPFYNR